MKKVWWVATVVLMLAGVAALNAQTVEVSLIEAAPAPGITLKRQSEFVIAGALDAFFESGKIGTNARPVTGDLAAFMRYVPEPDAAEAMIDYVLVILATYDGQNPVPSCRYRLIGIRDGRDAGSGEVPSEIPGSALDADVEKACMDVGGAVAAACFPSR
jgi:hypothetical protein